MTGPIELAKDVWWVGATLADDSFQCHAYFLHNGDQSVLIDAGSALTLNETLSKVAAIAPLDSIAYLLCHHSDPDIAAGLPVLGEVLKRSDVRVITEWRAQALLQHYGHRFGYYLIEENGWRLPLNDEAVLEFQLTPYLHFPGAFVSWESSTATLFSSDLFGGFVPDSAVLESHDLDYIIESARPFHQHYMPSEALLRAGLDRIQHRWSDIRRIAPQHGHVIPAELVTPAFEALKGLECGVFALADADLDLRRLLRLAEARSQLNAALVGLSGPSALVRAVEAATERTHQPAAVSLCVDLPGRGWVSWTRDSTEGATDEPSISADRVEIPGTPSAFLSLEPQSGMVLSGDLVTMIEEGAYAMRTPIDQYLIHSADVNRIARLRHASLTDPLTGLRNRRSLEAEVPTGNYSVLSLDLDHFKEINDERGHPAGDVVLRMVATTLCSCIRQGDASYRVGGEEFLIVLPGSDRRLAWHVAERIRIAVSELDLDGYAPAGHVTLSVGVVTVKGGKYADFESALLLADEALYRAKVAGRNRVEAAPMSGSGRNQRNAVT